MMLQTEKPNDYVCASCISHSVLDLCQYVFKSLDLNYLDYIKIDEKHFRPEELKDLKGDSSKLRKELAWAPWYTFEEMLDDMVEYWLNYYNEKNYEKTNQVD